MAARAARPGVLALAVLVAVATAVTAAASRPAPETSRPDAVEAPPALAYPVPAGAVFVAEGGDDAAAGTEAAPLGSLAAAVRRVPAGGTIVVRGGTYRQTVGDVTKRITVQPYPGERVWFKGSVVVDRWARDGRVWRHAGWTVRLCHTCFVPAIIDPAHPWAGLPDMVFVDDRPLRQVGTAEAVGAGAFFVDRERQELVIGDDPDGAVVEAAALDRLLQFDGGAGGSVVRGIGVAHYATNQNYGKRGAMIVVNAPDVTVENVTFAWSASSGLGVFQPGARVRGSVFRNNGLVGMVANRADDLRVTGSSFTGNNQERFALTGEAIGAAGAKVTRTKRPHFAGNTFADNIGTGWWCDLGCTDAVVVRNVAARNAGNGLYYEVSARALIASNVLAGNARGVKVSSSDHVRLHHNTFAGNRLSLGLYNDPRAPEFDAYAVERGLSWHTMDTALVNNFFAQEDADTPVIESADHKAAPRPEPFVAVADGNAYLRPSGPAPLVVWAHGGGRTAAYPTLAALTAATGADRHGLEAVPTGSPFTDPAGASGDRYGSYALRPDAPGFRAGRPLPAEVAAALGVPADPHPSIGILP
ncbi:Right handed beta helix region [Amycolatopsis arida]|uniref:Right handed beta helix region n=1 Tax=Amycolatopsis arida TaxID=587909 RepID=A0A1I5Z6S5_9PSEU|nr:right-handed parallel beta-helix repeat-containing protein [Amycolatopsis arida]TDX90186.1 parallel beta helix pectate lyase-like protein [Amycolatopsis arida]SFQ52169.1 Right handed beta helix region [Amycolatopsis arida]